MSAIDNYRIDFEKTIVCDVFKVGATKSSAAGYWYTTWPAAGTPSPGTYPIEPQTCDNTTIGSLNFYSSNQYINVVNASLSCQMVGGIYLLDRLIHTQPFSMATTTLQTISSVNLPSRVESNVGLEIWMEITTAIAANASGSVTITYVDENNVANKSTNNFPITTALDIKTAIQIPLASGTRGLTRLTGVQFSSGWTAGAASFVIAKRICTIPNKFANTRLSYGKFGLGDVKFDQRSCVMLVGNGAATASPTISMKLNYF